MAVEWPAAVAVLKLGKRKTRYGQLMGDPHRHFHFPFRGAVGSSNVLVGTQQQQQQQQQQRNSQTRKHGTSFELMCVCVNRVSFDATLINIRSN